MVLLCLSGCTIEQKATLGANDDRYEGYSGYGVQRVRNWEGPLMDMMVPDASPKGITDPAHELTTSNDYVSGNRNLGMNHEGNAGFGARVYTNRPGVLRDKISYSDQLTRDMSDAYSILTEENKDVDLKTKIESLDEVKHLYVQENERTVVIGLEGNHSSHQSLKQLVHQIAEKYYPNKQVIVTTDRQFIKRMGHLDKK